MSDLFSAIKLNESDVVRIKKHLENIKQSQNLSPEAQASVSTAAQEFSTFFKKYGSAYFTAHPFREHETAISTDYNENLTTLDQDLVRLYASLASATATSLSAFNFTSIITKEITNKAIANSSKVIDLNILNSFNKGQVIIAGDDFNDQSKIDSSLGIETSQAEILEGALCLKRVDSQNIITPNVKVTITPLKPIGANNQVNTDPTPNNLERFYEGKFYSFIGQMEPEGGQLQLKYIVDPSDIPAPSVSVTTNQQGVVVDSTDNGGADAVIEAAQSVGFYGVIPATEEQKQANRAKMFDGNPDTYWSCEFVYKTEPLIDPYDDQSIDLEPGE